MGGVSLGQIVLASVRRQTEGAMMGKAVSSTPPWPLHQLLPCLSSCSDFLQCWAMDMKVQAKAPFPPQLAFGHGVSSWQ